MKKMALSALMLLVSFSGFAENSNVKTFNLALIQLACSDPGAVFDQVPPSDIKITCGMSWSNWIPNGTTYSDMPNWKKVSGSIMTDKPGIKVPKSTWGLPIGSTQFSCPDWQEQVVDIPEMTFGVTCADILAMTSIKDFCSAKMPLEAEANESIMVVTSTGKVKGLCL